MCNILRGHERVCVCDHANRSDGYFELCVLLRGDMGEEGGFFIWIQYSFKVVPLELV